MEEVDMINEDISELNVSAQTPTPSVLSSGDNTAVSSVILPTFKFPPSRIRKIIKLDPQSPSQLSSEAVSMVAISAELFCEYLSAQASQLADKEKRKTILYRDVGGVVAGEERLGFLKEVVPEPVSFAAAVEAQKAAQKSRLVEDNNDGSIGQSLPETPEIGCAQ